MRQCILFVMLMSFIAVSAASRILGVFAHPVRSNTLYCHSVMSALAARGHDVVVYSPFNTRFTNSNITHVLIHTEFHASVQSLDFQAFVKRYSKISTFGGNVLRSVIYEKCDSFFKHSAIQALLYSKEHFDLVVTEGTFGEESILIFGHIFKAPTVVLLPAGTWSTVNIMAGNSPSIAYSPDYMAFAYSDKMNFRQRTLNFLSALVRLVYYYWYELPIHDTILKRHAGDRGAPPVEEMVRNVSLTLVNTHPAVGYSQPYSPNIVQIGGIHLNDFEDPLPKDIQKFIDDAFDGVIYFSLGSVVPDDTIPADVIQAFTNVFKTLPYRVIWKTSMKRPRTFPNNILLSKWLPQKYILDHPNCVLFITHGGISSQLEVLHAGVPVVGIPILTDQPYNVRLYQELGVGIYLDINSLLEQTVSTAINTVLKDKRYTENAKRVSRIFKDMPSSAADTAVYWMEYVIRHRGAPHLRPHAANMTWYQLIILDVIAVTLAVIIIVIFIILKFIKQFTMVYNFKVSRSNVKCKKNN